MHHVAVAHDVFLAFEPHLAGFLRALFTLVLDKLIIGNHFGANKAFLEIRVDDTGRLRRGIALMHGPRANFLRPDSEIRLQAQELVGRAYEAIQSRLLHAYVG